MPLQLETIDDYGKLISRLEELLAGAMEDGCATGTENKVLDESGVRVYVFFEGNHDPDTGKSWCPDCAKAEPVMDAAVKSVGASVEGHFIKCFVGKRESWKDPASPYRTDTRLHLEVIPTLLHLASGWAEKGRLTHDEDFASASGLEAFLQQP